MANGELRDGDLGSMQPFWSFALLPRRDKSLARRDRSAHHADCEGASPRLDCVLLCLRPGSDWVEHEVAGNAVAAACWRSWGEGRADAGMGGKRVSLCR